MTAAQLRAQIPSSTDPERLERLAREAEGNPAPRRIQRRRSKGWRMPPGAIYCGRPTDFGNRYAIGQEIEHVDGTTVFVRDAAHAVKLFREWWDWQAERLPSMRTSIVHLLGGRDLLCWCRLDAPCHVDVLLELANKS